MQFCLIYFPTYVQCLVIEISTNICWNWILAPMAAVIRTGTTTHHSTAQHTVPGTTCLAAQCRARCFTLKHWNKRLCWFSRKHFYGMNWVSKVCAAYKRQTAALIRLLTSGRQTRQSIRKRSGLITLSSVSLPARQQTGSRYSLRMRQT